MRAASPAPAPAPQKQEATVEFPIASVTRARAQTCVRHGDKTSCSDRVLTEEPRSRRAKAPGNDESKSPRELPSGKPVCAGDSCAGGDAGAFFGPRRQTSQFVIFHLPHPIRLAVVCSTPDPALMHPLIQAGPKVWVKRLFWFRNSSCFSTSGLKRLSGMLGMRS